MTAITITRISGLAAVLWLLSACTEEPKPRSVQEFLDNPIMLEATMVRCSANRNDTRYDAECINARQAVSAIEAREERERREAFEAQSQKKREALRRTQRAAAEARRRAAEAERRRKEADYLAQFGELPPESSGDENNELNANQPGMVLPSAPQENAPAAESSSAYGGPAPDYQTTTPVRNERKPATDAGNAPEVDTAPADLDAVRDELRRRAGGDGDH